MVNRQIKTIVLLSVLKLKRTSNGYLSVKLFKDGIAKHHLVHRLVAKEFLINKDDKPQVNHIDGIKHNNEITKPRVGYIIREFKTRF